MNDVDRSIDGIARTISDVLDRKKYSIDYYQREYKWESKQLAELVADLTSKFLQLHEPGHTRRDVKNYPGYFLGSIIVSQRGSESFIIDGQQRLTSLTLLLAYLRRLQHDRVDVVDVDQLIFSETFGENSFNLDVPDRNACMEALFEHGCYEPPADAPDSVRTLVGRYSELEGLFPDELKDAALPYFLDWLKDRVQVVQITAYSDDDAYAIFETMNDRGLRLAPADMLKGYLLANVEIGEPRTAANKVWREQLRKLKEYDDEAGSDFLKTWLRSQYATRIRERKRGARPENWDRIGTEFHRWLRNSHTDIGLRNQDGYYRFVVRDFAFYCRQYERLLDASWVTFDRGGPLRFVRYNADLGFTLQYQLLLAPLCVEDDQQTVDRKLEIVGRFVDILLVRRIWNFRATAYSTVQYAMFTVMRDIRGLGAPELAETLREYLRKTDETFDSNPDLHVHQQNRNGLHRVLARITDYITVGSGQASNYVELTNGAGVKYEVEHVWADHAERHVDDFPHASDFAWHRIESVAYCCFRSRSTPATVTRAMWRRCRTTSGRTCSRPASTRCVTRRIRPFSHSSSRVRFRSSPTTISKQPTSSSVVTYTVPSRIRFGIPTLLLRLPKVSQVHNIAACTSKDVASPGRDSGWPTRPRSIDGSPRCLCS